MNTTSFNSEISDYRPALMRNALKFTRNHDDADDLVQETLVKAIRHENHFQHGTNLKGWLFTIMRNTFINNYRSLAKRSAVFVNNGMDIYMGNTGKDLQRNSGEGKFIMEDVNKALHQLNPIYARPFLRYFEGYKYHEIAEELEIPVGTVKTRIHMARKILKESLKMYI